MCGALGVLRGDFGRVGLRYCLFGGGCVVYFACCRLCLFGGCFRCGCFNSVVVLDDVISFGVRKVCYEFGCLVYY